MAEQELRYLTTKPIIKPYSQHPTILTSDPNVYLRPYRLDDLADLHEMRTQWEVMQWTSKQRVDADLGETETWMRRFLEVEKKLEDEVEQALTPTDGGNADNDDKNDNNDHKDQTSKHDENVPQQLSDKVKQTSINKTTFNFVVVHRNPDTVTSGTQTPDLELKHDHDSGQSHSQGRSQIETRSALPTQTSTQSQSRPLKQLQTQTQPQSARREKVIGSLGCHTLATPSKPVECGYMLRKEYWGRGIASLVLAAFFNTWWSLDREILPLTKQQAEAHCERIGIDPASLTPTTVGREDRSHNDTHNDNHSHDEDDSEGGNVVWIPELLYAEIDADNIASRRVLDKFGFRLHKEGPLLNETTGQILGLADYYMSAPTVGSREHWRFERWMGPGVKVYEEPVLWNSMMRPEV